MKLKTNKISNKERLMKGYDNIIKNILSEEVENNDIHNKNKIKR